MTKLSKGQREQKTRGSHFNSGLTGFDLEVSLALPEYPIQFPDKMEIELDISFIYNQLNQKSNGRTNRIQRIYTVRVCEWTLQGCKGKLSKETKVTKETGQTGK